MPGVVLVVILLRVWTMIQLNIYNAILTMGEGGQVAATAFLLLSIAVDGRIEDRCMWESDNHSDYLC